MNKQEALAHLREEFAWWEDRLATLSEAQLTSPQFAENWSIKDVVAHVHAWQQRSVARFEAAQRNAEPQYPAWPEQFDPEMEGEPHDLNEWLYQQARDQTWSRVHQDWRDTFVRLLELGAAVPEPDLLDKHKYVWLDGYALVDVLQGSYEHHHEHAEYLQPVLDRFQQREA